jgi:glucosamine--fructose-6-phosphate aminotransferase (isomerizing)
VLKLTRAVVPLSEGEAVEFDAEGHQLFKVKNGPGYEAGDRVERAPVRSRLRAKDTALLPAFEYYMDQEIAAEEHTARRLLTLHGGGSEAARALAPAFEVLGPGRREELGHQLDALRDQYDDDALRAAFFALVDSPEVSALLCEVPAATREALTGAGAQPLADALVSSEAGLFTDLLAMARGDDDRLAVRLFDVLLEGEEVREYRASLSAFGTLALETLEKNGRLFILSCGSSFHAAKAAALFFNELARTEVIPVLPGELRGQYLRTLREGDALIAVSQSGETKDLIDVVNQVIATGIPVRRVALVNNLSSTLAQEKSELVIPLRCGPEIAVPATKRFMSQLVVFYLLALELAERRLAVAAPGPDTNEARAALAEHAARFARLPELLRATMAETGPALEEAAELLYLAPSMHILAIRLTAVAKEGALKIREVVLNHTEGYEGSEFKHGPNTILGFNTLFGPLQLERLLTALAARLGDGAGGPTLSHELETLFAADAGGGAGRFDMGELQRALRADYPLIYVTGPAELDVNLTISQLNTHKIRGASTVVIAEDSAQLMQAAKKPPADNADYRSVYVALPKTGDTLLTVFSSTLALQRLALLMSRRKKAYLDRLGFVDHGVHPDVPKNVSKSITVD